MARTRFKNNELVSRITSAYWEGYGSLGILTYKNLPIDGRRKIVKEIAFRHLFWACMCNLLMAIMPRLTVPPSTAGVDVLEYLISGCLCHLWKERGNLSIGNQARHLLATSWNKIVISGCLCHLSGIIKLLAGSNVAGGICGLLVELESR
jgi:hypothetical protein